MLMGLSIGWGIAYRFPVDLEPIVQGVYITSSIPGIALPKSTLKQNILCNIYMEEIYEAPNIGGVSN